jgi:hypothetical protein
MRAGIPRVTGLHIACIALGTGVRQALLSALCRSKAH